MMFAVNFVDPAELARHLCSPFICVETDQEPQTEDLWLRCMSDHDGFT